MKFQIRSLILVVLVTSTLATHASAKSSEKANKARATKGLGAKLDTDHHFNDLTVRGKYQSASEGLVTVENEKLVEDILDYRNHFSDRIKKSLQEM